MAGGSNAARVAQLVSDLSVNPPRIPRPMPAPVLAELRMPDGSLLAEDLATWLAFDASWLPLTVGEAQPAWSLAEAPQLRPRLAPLGLPADVPLVELEPAGSHDLFLALAPTRGNPVLAWDQADLWLAAETFADFLRQTFPPPAPTPRPLAGAKVGRLRALDPAAVGALTAAELATTARGLGEKVNARLLKDTAFVEAVVRALTRQGLWVEALFVLRSHAAVWRNGISQAAMVCALELAATWKDREACRFALDAYRARAGRDPDVFHSFGQLHVLALRCAEVTDEREPILELVERVILFLGLVSDSVPVTDPALAALWERPAMSPFAARVAELATRPTKKRKKQA